MGHEHEETDHMSQRTHRDRRGWGKIRRLPSGRWQASYIGRDKHRHAAPVTYSTRLAAEGWLAGERRLYEDAKHWTPPVEREAAAHAQREAQTLTLGEYADEWITHRDVKPRTREGYRALLANHIKPALGDTPVGEMTAPAVRAWYAGLATGPTAKAHAYQLLHAVLATAATDGLLAANPCTIKRAMSTSRTREPVILTPAEVAALADAIRPSRYRALVLIAAWLGLRWGELIELRRKDIGAGAVTITVARAVTHREGCHISTPKSGRGRSVVVPDHIRGEVKHHLDTHVGESPEALLFAPAQGGCHLNDQVFREQFNAALKAIGREGVRVHDLRHYAGTMATLAGGSLAEVMARLGHTTTKAAMLYQQVASGRAEEIAAGLSRLAEAVASG
jgi:integrase